MILSVFILIIMPLLQFSQAQDCEGENPVTIHGFISQGYMQSTNNNFYGNTIDGTFKFNEFGLNISSQITDNLHIGMQLFSRNLGYLGGSKVYIDWAYGDYHWQDWMGIRAGKIKMPLGFYNETRDVDMLRTSIFMPQGVYRETSRASINAIQGVGLYGNTAGSLLGSLEYQVQIGTYDIETSSAMNKLIQGRLYATISEYHISTAFVGSLIWETPLEGLRIGASGYITELTTKGMTDDSYYWRNATSYAYWNMTGKQTPYPPSYEDASQFIDFVNMPIKQEFNNFSTFFLSGEYKLSGLTLAAEYFKQQGTVITNAIINTSQNTVSNSIQLNEANANLGGYYGSIDYQFNELFSMCSYYSVYYPDLDDKDGKKLEQIYGMPASRRWFKDFSISGKFNINSNWIAKLEGHHIDGTAIIFRADQPDPSDLTRWWYLFAAKLTYNF
jgi:hypothetical protein